MEGEGDEPLWLIGRGTRVPLQGAADVVPVLGAIAHCHCSVGGGGGLTTNFGGVDVVPLLGAIVGCHCSVVWSGEGDDQLWGSGRGAIAGCHCSVLSSEDQHPPNCYQKLHLWHSLGISSHVKPIAVSNSKLRKASNILLGIFDPNIFQTWGSCSQRPWETDCSRFLHVPIGHLLQVEKKTCNYWLHTKDPGLGFHLSRAAVGSFSPLKWCGCPLTWVQPQKIV